MKRKLLTLMAALVLTLSIASCATKIEYVREIPAVSFPVFPTPDCVEYDEETDTVLMPLWYWQKIAEYKIDVDAARDFLARLRQEAENLTGGNK